MRLLIEFAKWALGAEERYRTVGSAGSIHAEVRIGESMMIGGGGGGTSWSGPSKPTAIHLFVDNVDEVFKRAVETGAAALVEPADLLMAKGPGA
jgi:PhnB protein